jgi:membrane-bound lytic murein transglycosylase D
MVLTQTVVFGMQPSPLYYAHVLPSEWVHQPWQTFQPRLVTPHFADVAKDLTALLHETLPRFNIDPRTVPASFQEQLRKRLYEYGWLYRRDLQNMLRRAGAYLPMIKLALKQQNLPGYFAFLPLVESAFEPRALHPESGARGLWQLMPDTARAYGLRVSNYIDERLDPFRASRAAARYLRELHDLFGANSPLLVLAAYNYGENNIVKAMERARTRDVWGLFHKRQLPYETRDFLVKMVTLWVLITQAQHFQLTIETTALSQSYTEISFPHAVSLATIAQLISMPLAQLRDINPQILSPRLPAYVPLRVPPASMARSSHFEVWVPSPLAAEDCCTHVVVETCQHTVEPGESVSTIAQQYNTDVATLKLLNQLTGANPVIRPGQELVTCDVSPTRLPVYPELW